MEKEISQELIKVLRNLNRERPSRNKFVEFLNSPFAITFVGGLIAAIITLIVQFQFEKGAEERLRLQVRIEKMQTTLTIFSDGIVKSLQASIGMRKRGIWLKTHKNDKNKESLFYPDQRNFIETRDFWEKQRALFETLRHPDSLCAEARAIFNDKETADLIDELDIILDNYFVTWTIEELIDNYNKATKLYQVVVASMGKQLDQIQKGKKANGSFK
jgi:hypothetical protein